MSRGSEAVIEEEEGGGIRARCWAELGGQGESRSAG